MATSHPSLSRAGVLKRQNLQMMAGKAGFDGLEELSDEEAKIMVAAIGNMLPYNVRRCLEASFNPTRRNYITESEFNRSEFESFMSRRSQLATRVRMTRNVPDSDESERVRIINEPWNDHFKAFQAEQRRNGDHVISISALNKIRKNYLPHYRRAVKSDLAYASCATCHMFDLILATLRKSPIPQLSQTFAANSKGQLLRLSVCDVNQEKCLLGNCVDCEPESTLSRVIDLIEDYDLICETGHTWLEKSEYTNREGGTKTTIYVKKVGTVAEMIVDLVDSMYTGASTATGKKVKSHL